MRDSVKIYFRQGYSILDLSIRDNRQVLERIADSLSIGYADSVYTPILRNTVNFPIL